MEKETQKKRVLSHLKKYGKITSAEAFTWYGITRLADVIFKLRKDGYEITTQDTVGKNRYNEDCRYATYVIAESELVWK